MSRVHHLRRLVAAAVLLLVTVLGVTSASGAPGAAAPAKSARAAAAAAAVAPGQVDPKYGIRGPVSDLNGNFNAPETVYDAVQAGTSATVAKSKTTITLPPSVFLTYVRICGKAQFFREDGSPYFGYYCCPDGQTTANCPSSLIPVTPATSNDDTPLDLDNGGNSVSWTRATGPIWAASPPGSSRPYGVFPATRVSLLGFGSLPATATVHISQPMRGAAVTPLQYSDLTLSSGAPPNTIVAGFPTAPELNELFIAARSLRGKVDVRLSDVRIDGRSVDVGSSCRAENASLDYTAPRGPVSTDATPSSLLGRPGEFDPLNAVDPGIGHGSISVPAFRGCRDGSRSLDPLVTALATGKSAVTLRLRSGADACANDTNPVKGCPAYPGYDGPISQQPALVRALAKMRGGMAKNLVASLPQAIRRELPAKYRR